jgi:nucleotide-binding universal stress UspA family protein
MQRFRRILVIGAEPDDTRELLARAGDLAARNGGTVDLFDVVEAVPERRRFFGSGPSTIDIQDAALRRRRAELDALAASVDVPIGEIGVGAGTAYTTIIERAARAGNDLLMLRSDEMPTRRGLAGATTTMHLLRKSPIPVWVARDTGDRPGVAVAVGPFVESSPTELDVMLLEMASSLAALRGDHLHILHAWRLEGESMLRSHRLAPSGEEVDELVAAVGIEKPSSVHLVQGRAGEVLPTALDGIRPGVLVMGTLARAGVRGMIIGNTAERILSLTDASVLAAKPDGFVSPVLA